MRRLSVNTSRANTCPTANNTYSDPEYFWGAYITT